jgi:tetratricopeptide (TPR) repeat protein
MRWRYVVITIVFSAGLALAESGQAPDGSTGDRSQDRPQDRPQDGPKDAAKSPASAADQLPPSQAPPRSDRARSDSAGDQGRDPAEAAPTLPSAAAGDDRNFSSSRENIVDLSPPKDDLKDHPGSATAMARSADDESVQNADVQEFHQWNPMKALKDVEIGDYYFKRKNYRAAMDRYKEALFYKENDALATFRLAVSQEKLQDKAGALSNYIAYLKILPHGPFADEARESIARLGGEAPGKQEAATQQATPEKR